MGTRTPRTVVVTEPTTVIPAADAAADVEPVEDTPPARPSGAVSASSLSTEDPGYLRAWHTDDGLQMLTDAEARKAGLIVDDELAPASPAPEASGDDAPAPDGDAAAPTA